MSTMASTSPMSHGRSKSEPALGLKQTVLTPSRSASSLANAAKSNAHSPKTRVLRENQQRSADSPSAGSVNSFKFFSDESDAATMRSLLEKENNKTTTAATATATAHRTPPPLPIEASTPKPVASTEPRARLSSILSSGDRVVMLSRDAGTGRKRKCNSPHTYKPRPGLLGIRPQKELAVENTTSTCSIPPVRPWQPKLEEQEPQTTAEAGNDSTRDNNNSEKVATYLDHTKTTNAEGQINCRALVVYTPLLSFVARDTTQLRLYPSMSTPPEIKLEASRQQLHQARSISILLDFLSAYLPLLRKLWINQASSGILRRDNQKSQSLLMVPYEGSEEVLVSNRGMVLYTKNDAQKRQIQMSYEFLRDPEIQYGLALFQLLVLKNQSLILEHHHYDQQSKNSANSVASSNKSQAQCLENFVQTIDFCVELRGESHATPLQMEMVQALDALGELHRDGFRDFPQAFVYFTRALETKSFIYGADAKNLDLASSMETLGVLMRDRLGCMSDSIRCFQQALTMKRQVYQRCLPPGGSSRQWAELAQTYHSLGLAYDMSADYHNATQYYEMALTARHKQQQCISQKYGHTLGQERRKQHALAKANQKRIATLFNLGCVSEKLNKLEDARAYLEEALQMQYQLHNSNPYATVHPHYDNSDSGGNSRIGILFRLASIYERCKELEGAYKYYKIALDIHYQAMQSPIDASHDGANSKTHHPLLLALLHGAATASNLLGYYEDSLFAYESLIETLRLKGVADKRLLIPTLHHLGLLNDVLGRGQKASKYYRHTLMLVDSDDAWKESAVAHNIRMNVLCLADPTTEDPKPQIHALTKTPASSESPAKSSPRKSSNAKNQVVFDKVFCYFLDNIKRYYKRQDYVHKDAAMAITYRNAALLSATRVRNHTDARAHYEQYLETIWYHNFRVDENNHGPPGSNADNNRSGSILTSRCLVVSQALYALGIVERKLRQYAAARHYQKEGIALIAKAKKKELKQNGGCISTTQQEAKRRANLQSAMEKEVQLLNGGCRYVSFLMD